MLNPCAPESKARTGRFLRGRHIYDHYDICFLPMIANKERRMGNIPWAFFTEVQGFGQLDAGSRAS